MFKFRRENLILEMLQHVRNMVLINESRSDILMKSFWIAKAFIVISYWLQVYSWLAIFLYTLQKKNRVSL